MKPTPEEETPALPIPASWRWEYHPVTNQPIALDDGEGNLYARMDETAQRLIASAPALVAALQEMVNAGGYCVDLMHSAANPKSMEPVDWKGVALHMYAAMNGLPAARNALKAAGSPSK